jgi:alanine racemase
MNADTRPTNLYVDLKAIEYNIREIQKKISSQTHIMAVIKASGYGSGAVNIIRTLMQNGISRLGVALANEGVELRSNGVTIPINVLIQPFYSELEKFPQYDLIPAIADIDIAQKLNAISDKMNKATKVHVEIDTGIGRIGIQPKDAIQFVVELKKLKNIEVEGIFTHFASSDSNEKYTQMQIFKFNEVLNELAEKGIDISIKHACNSAGLVNYPEAHYNMVRPGLMLYGYYPDQEIRNKINLKPSLTLKSKVAFIKEVPPETAISYGGKFVTKRVSKIATIPLGYADGYRRELSNKGFIFVGGKIVPIVGTICMDVFMADVTDVDHVKAGDEVILFDNCNITVEEIAKQCGTINYEIISTIGERVPRVYNVVTQD